MPGGWWPVARSVVVRIAFFIVCLATIGVTLVQVRAEEARVRNETLMLRNYCDIEIPRLVWSQEAEIARLASFRQVGERGEAIAATLVDRTERVAMVRGLKAQEPTRCLQATPAPARRETPPPTPPQRNNRPIMRPR